MRKVILGAEWRKQRLTCGLEALGRRRRRRRRKRRRVGGSGVRAHLSAELNNAMATA